MGPGRFTYCYTPLGLRKGASPHRCRHGTVRKEGSNPRQNISTEELVCPARLARPGRAACACLVPEVDLLLRTMTPLEAICL